MAEGSAFFKTSNIHGAYAENKENQRYKGEFGA
jgi:hypothetical protein